MNIGRILKSAARYAKNNPEKVLMVASLVAPKVVTKVAPKVVQAIATAKVVKGR